MESNEKSKRWRSPNYPMITLQRGFELIDTLYKNHNIYFVALEVIGKDWGFTSNSSYLSQHIGALTSYGLIEVEGVGNNRRVKISDVAFKIISDNRPDSEERRRLIKECALLPDIFNRIYKVYSSGLPADNALEYELVHQFKFNPKSVNEFIGILKRTMDYARVYESGIIGDKDEPIKEPDMVTVDKPTIKESPDKIYSPNVNPKEREIANYPVGRGLKARILISGEAPVTTEAIDKLLKLLELNKDDLPESINNGRDKPLDQ